MPSSPDATSPRPARALAHWNARFHYYTGLFLLFFLWLFAVTGLLLNHGSWGMGAGPRARTAARSEHAVTVPNTGHTLSDARALMQALQLEGEVQWLGTAPDDNRLVFRVTRPGRQSEVRLDRRTATVVVEQTSSDALGVARALHLFTGVRLNDAKNDRDWIVTQAWALAMDGIAAGLLVLVLGGLAIWWLSGAPRWPGLIALGLGALCCGWFLLG